MFIDYEFNFQNQKLAGIDNRLSIMNTDGTYPQQLILDNKHYPTLEYFDW
jgi:hypothetical protein